MPKITRRLEKALIPLFKITKEATELYHACPSDMQSVARKRRERFLAQETPQLKMVKEKWLEMILPPVATAKRAKLLHDSYTSVDMKPAAMKLWRGLVTQEIPLLKNVAEAQELHTNCPPDMQSIILQKINAGF